jgi:hypothetical protein
MVVDCMGGKILANQPPNHLRHVPSREPATREIGQQPATLDLRREADKTSRARLGESERHPAAIVGLPPLFRYRSIDHRPLNSHRQQIRDQSGWAAPTRGAGLDVVAGKDGIVEEAQSRGALESRFHGVGGVPFSPKAAPEVESGK